MSANEREFDNERLRKLLTARRSSILLFLFGVMLAFGAFGACTVEFVWWELPLFVGGAWLAIRNRPFWRGGF